MSIDVKAVIEAVATAIDVPAGELDPETASESVSKWDSLAHLRVCMAIEERFGVPVAMEKIPELDSILKIVAYLEG